MSPKNMGLGHGISDSVRNSIGDWMTDRVIDIMASTLKYANFVSPSKERDTFKSRVRTADEWSRIKREKDLKAGVWKRTYYSKLFGKDGPGLTVLTNKGDKTKEEDMYIEYVTITYGNKVIGGGKVSIPSVKLSQLGRKPTIRDFQTESIFAEFTEKELAVLSAELEFGDADSLTMMLEERFV